MLCTGCEVTVFDIVQGFNDSRVKFLVGNLVKKVRHPFHVHTTSDIHEKKICLRNHINRRLHQRLLGMEDSDKLGHAYLCDTVPCLCGTILSIFMGAQ